MDKAHCLSRAGVPLLALGVHSAIQNAYIDSQVVFHLYTSDTSREGVAPGLVQAGSLFKYIKSQDSA